MVAGNRRDTVTVLDSGFDGLPKAGKESVLRVSWPHVTVKRSKGGPNPATEPRSQNQAWFILRVPMTRESVSVPTCICRISAGLVHVPVLRVRSHGRSVSGLLHLTSRAQWKRQPEWGAIRSAATTCEIEFRRRQLDGAAAAPGSGCRRAPPPAAATAVAATARSGGTSAASRSRRPVYSVLA